MMRNSHRLVATVVVVFALAQAAFAVQIAGVDFDDGLGGFDATPDDLNFDSISVSDWVFVNGGGISHDGNSDTDRASAPLGKFNGENGGTQPTVGAAPPTNNIHWFSITIPTGVSLDLTRVTFDFSAATPGTNQRWLAFKTSLDTNLLYSTIGSARPTLDSADIALTGAQYENLTNQTIDFQWYAGGAGSGDIDIDSILIQGEGVPQRVGPQLTVDRDTGGITLATDVNTAILGYTIQSKAGALDPASWTPIAGNYDAPPANGGTTGDGSVDIDDTWDVLTAAGVGTDLSEAQLSGTGPFDGGMITTGSPIDLSSSGGAWRKFYEEDLGMLMLRADGTEHPVPVTFAGNGDEPFALGDFNFDGAIDADDHAIFAAGLHTDLSDLTIATAYADGGDMNQDLVNNFADLVIFRNIYDGIHGTGAYAALAASVPEPSTLALLLLAGVFLVRQRKSLLLGKHLVRAAALVLVMVSFASADPLNVVLVQTNNATADYTNYLSDSFIDFTLTTGQFLDPVNVPAESDALLAADLVIISRHTGSGSYDDSAAEVDFWNSLTQPILLNSGYIARGNNRWGWTNTTAVVEETTAGNETTVLLSTDPLFEGVTIMDEGGSNVADLFTGNIRALPDSADIGADGTLLATGVGTGAASIARFAAGNAIVDPMAATSQLTHAGPRIFFGLHETGSATNGGIPTLSDEGRTVLSNALAELGMTPVPEPQLLVNTTTGQIKMVSDSSLAIELNYYEITSEDGSLDPTDGTGWNSLEDQGIGFGPKAGESWTEAGGSDANILSEFFTLGATSLTPQAPLSLGKGFGGSAEDLQFRYGVAGSDTLFEGKVEYETGGTIPGDFNGNGQVEQGDLDLVLLNWGDSTLPPGWDNTEQPPTFPIGQADLDAVRQNWGSSSAIATAAAVPEPTSVVLLIFGMFAMGLARRR